MAELWNPEAEEIVNVPDAEVENYFKAGFTLPKDLVVDTPEGPMVNFVDPETQEAFAKPYGEARKTLREGFKLESLEQGRARSVREKYGDRELTAAALGAIKSLSFGTAVPMMVNSGMVSKKTLKGLEEANPVSYTVGDIGATVGSALVPGGQVKAVGALGKLLKGAQLVTAPTRGVMTAGRVASEVATKALAKKLAGRAGAEGFTLARQVAARAGGEALGGILEGAAYEAGQYISDAALDKVELSPSAMISHVGLGGILGGLGGGLIGAGGVLGTKAISSAGNRIARALGKDKAAKYFEGLAQESALKALGASQATFGKLEKEVREAGTSEIADRIGGHIVKTGEHKGKRVIEAFDNVVDIKPKMEQAKKDALEELDAFRREVFAAADDATGPTYEELFRRVDDNVIRPLKASEIGDNLVAATKVQRMLKPLRDKAEAPMRRVAKLQKEQGALEGKLATIEKKLQENEISLATTINGQKRQATELVPDVKLVRKLEVERSELEAAHLELLAKRDSLVGARKEVVDKIASTPSAVPVTLKELTDFRIRLDKVLRPPKRPKGAGVMTTSASDFPKHDARRTIEKYIEEVTDRTVDAKLPAKAGQYQELKKTYWALSHGSDILNYGLSRKAGNRFISPTDYFTGGLGVMGSVGGQLAVGDEDSTVSALQAMALGAAGAFGHKLIRERGRSTMTVLARKAAGLGAIAKATRAMSERIESATSTVASGKVKTRRSFAAQVATKAFQALGMKDEPKETRARTAKRAEFLTQMAKDPIGLSARVSSGLGSLQGIAPNVAQSLSAKAINTAQFLAMKAPKRPTLSGDLQPFARQWLPSQEESERFERYVAAAHDPMSVIDDLESGTVTVEGVETLRTLHPELYREASQSLLTKVAGMTEPLPYSRLMDLGIFLGIPTHPNMSPQYLSAIASSSVSRETPERQQPGRPFPTNRIQEIKPRMSGADSVEFAS